MALELLTLALLALMQRTSTSRPRRIIGVATLALAGTSASALADSQNERDSRGWYVGLTTGQVRGSIDAADMDKRLAAQGFTTHTTLSGQNRFGGMFDVGYRLRRAGLELGYADLGRLTTVVEGPTPVDDVYLAAISRAHPRSGNGPRLSGLLFLPLGERIELFGRGGIFYWKTTMSAKGFGQFVGVNDRSLDPFFGAGADVRLTERLHARLELTRYRLDGENLTFAGLGVSYKLSINRSAR